MPRFAMIPGYPGYRVGSDASVWSRHLPGGGLRRQWRELLRQPDDRGRRFVTLSFNGDVRRLRVSRLVLLAFRGQPRRGHECCHKNGDATDDRLRNVRWGTRRSNCADKRRHGTAPTGARNGNAKITSTTAVEIRTRWLNGELQTALAEEFLISQPTVSQICRGLTWR